MSYVSLRTVFYMIRLTDAMSVLETKVAPYSMCIPVISLCPLTSVQPKHVVFIRRQKDPRGGQERCLYKVLQTQLMEPHSQL